MRSTLQPCLRTAGKIVPATPAWQQEVKYDGYRLIVARYGDRARLFTRNGRDRSGRLPLDRPERAEEPAQAVRSRSRSVLGILAARSREDANSLSAQRGAKVNVTLHVKCTDCGTAIDMDADTPDTAVLCPKLRQLQTNDHGACIGRPTVELLP